MILWESLDPKPHVATHLPVTLTQTAISHQQTISQEGTKHSQDGSVCFQASLFNPFHF